MRRGLLFLPLILATGCAIFRPPPPAPQPPLPAVDTGEAAPDPVAAPRPTRGLMGLAAAHAALATGLAWEADVILQGVEEVAVEEGDKATQARALVQRAALALGSGGRGQEAAAAFLEQAVEADPGGPQATPADLSIRMLALLNERAQETQALRQRLAALEKDWRQEQDAAAGLRTEVEALKKQLDELKEVHLRIESEKKDDPS